MREIVLNRASISAPCINTATGWLATTIREVGCLISNGITFKYLRQAEEAYNIYVCGSVSLNDVARRMALSNCRDEFNLWSSLTSRVPAYLPDTETLLKAMGGIEAVDDNGDRHQDIIFCASVFGIAVGFPSEESWQASTVKVRYLLLQDDGQIVEYSDNVDHVSSVGHGTEIVERTRLRIRDEVTTGESLWNHRTELYPDMEFGADIERAIGNLAGSALLPVLRKLEEINEGAKRWREDLSPWPTFACKVTSESGRVMEDPELKKFRFFRSSTGGQILCEHHARVGNSIRIHFHIDAKDKKVTVGYIGQHLPL